MSMLRLIAAALLLLAPVPGLAQAPQLPAGQVLGNDTASTRTARGASLSAMFDRGLSSTRGAILERGAAGWVAITPGTAGLPFVSAGAGADPLYQILGLSGGGTNNGSIVASNGGIVYSDATKLNILAATATARQMLQSGASGAPSWSTTTWPATTTVNRILYSSSANVIGEIATASNGILVTDGSGVPSISTTLPSGLTGGPAEVLLNTLTASGSVSLSDTTSLTATYKNYKVVFQNVIPVTNGACLQLTVSTDGGSSYLTTNYISEAAGFNGTSSAADTSTSAILIGGGATNIGCPGNTAGYSGLSGHLYIHNPAGGSLYTAFEGQVAYYSSVPANVIAMLHGFNTTTSAVNAIKFAESSGNISSGVIKIYGMN